MFAKLERAVPEIIKTKKRELEEEFGDASGFGIVGVVVVGSVAGGTETSESDVDIYVLSRNGRNYVDDFADALQVAIRRDVELLGTIKVAEGEEFEPTGSPPKPHKFIRINAP